MKATVAFSPETPLEPAYGGVIPVGGRRHVGDTVIMRETLSPDPVYQRGQRLVEVVVNGRVAASREVPADGREHAVEFSVPIERSSWIAVRQFPQLHTNPVNVLVAGQAHPRVTGERSVGPRLHRSTLARARAPDCAGRARRGGKSLRRSEGDLPPNCVGVAGGAVSPETTDAHSQSPAGSTSASRSKCPSMTSAVLPVRQPWETSRIRGDESSR